MAALACAGVCQAAEYRLCNVVPTSMVAQDGRRLVWNPDVVKTPVCRTLGPDEWKRFHCVEPCTLTPQLLKPGETRAHGMTLRVDRPLTSD